MITIEATELNNIPYFEKLKYNSGNGYFSFFHICRPLNIVAFSGRNTKLFYLIKVDSLKGILSDLHKIKFEEQFKCASHFYNSLNHEEQKKYFDPYYEIFLNFKYMSRYNNKCAAPEDISSLLTSNHFRLEK